MKPAAKIKDCDEVKNDFENCKPENIKIDDNRETMKESDVWIARNDK